MPFLPPLSDSTKSQVSFACKAFISSCITSSNSLFCSHDLVSFNVRGSPSSIKILYFQEISYLYKGLLNILDFLLVMGSTAGWTSKSSTLGCYSALCMLWLSNFWQHIWKKETMSASPRYSSCVNNLNLYIMWKICKLSNHYKSMKWNVESYSCMVWCP